MFLNTFLLLVSTIYLYLYWFYKKSFQFFEKRNAAYVKPRAIFGNITEAVFKKKALSELYIEIYRKLKPHKIGGFFSFHEPYYMVCDRELMKNILIKDFEHFPDRFFSKHTKNDLLSNTLVTIHGEEWKNLRAKLTPTFTSGKLKAMFPLMEACGKNLVRVMKRFNPDEDIEYKELCSRYSTDVMAICAFGLEANTLEHPESELLKRCDQVFNDNLSNFKLGFIPTIPRHMAEFIKLCISDKTFERFYYSIFRNTISYRKANKITRNDFLDLLINLKDISESNKLKDEHDTNDLKKAQTEGENKGNKNEVEITEERLVAQALIFLAGGYHPISTAMSFALLELVLNPDIQEKVRVEITTVLKNNGNELSYTAMRQMKYLEMVIDETLRKHPSNIKMSRRCAHTYNVPGTKTVINKDDQLVIPIYALHMDKEYYEKPDEFYPEHFIGEAIAKRPAFSYLPFGAGQHHCIASRFSKMNIKLGLIIMLNNFSFGISSRMKLPIKYSPGTSHLVSVDGGVWLRCRKIDVQQS